MTCRVCVFAFAILASAANAAVMRDASNNFLGSDAGERMRPDVVATTLAKIEDEWKKDADVFTECNSTTADCKGAPESFAKSCATVVSSVVQGSGGDRDVVQEYMSNVCSQKVLKDWHKLRCNDFASAIVSRGMTGDKYANRNNMNAAKVCNSFWPTFVTMERKREEEEAKKRAEEEKIRAEQEKKAAEEAAAAKKKAEEEARVEAERRAKAEQEAEARRVKEEQEQKAKREAEEAKARAAESAARLAQAKAEAAEVQAAAQLKMQEAAIAEKEHLALQAEHKKAEELLHGANATKEELPKQVETPAPATEPKLTPKASPVKASPPVAKEAAAPGKTAPVAVTPAKGEKQ